MNLLRKFSPRLAPGALTGRRAAAVLREWHAAMSRLVAMLDEAGTTIGHIALHLCDTGLFEFDDRCARVLGFVRDAADAAQEPEATDAVPAEGLSSDVATAKFFKCSAKELWPYERYVSEGSPYATQHGVKGAQFERVMVVMDEEESDYRITTTRVSSRVLRPVLQIVHEHWAVMKILGVERCDCFTSAALAPSAGWYKRSSSPIWRPPWKPSWRAGARREAQSLRRNC